MFKCPNCKTETSKLIAPEGDISGLLRCRNCYAQRNIKSCLLGSVVDKWEKPNGRTGRMTYGKMREIESRRVAEDGVTVINYETGKETQY